MTIWRAYASEMESSLEATYGRDVIGEWIRGDMSSRKLISLLNGLPPECLFWNKVREDHETVQAEARQEVTTTARRGLMGGAYRNVPEHLKPDYLREVV